MFNCQKYTQLLSLSQEQPLTLIQKMSLKVHTIMCSRCKAFQTNHHHINRIFKHYHQK